MKKSICFKSNKDQAIKSPLYEVLAKRVAEIKDEDGGTTDGVYYAVASDPSLDRDFEVLMPKGARLDNFLRTPTMLQIHNYREVPVAKALAVEVDDDAVGFAFEFAETETGQEYRYLYDNGYMNAFSVGFIPQPGGYRAIDEDDREAGEVELEIRGAELKLDLSRYEFTPRGIYTDWELIEISPVPVPSNPNALLMREAELAAAKVEDPVLRKMVAGQLKDLVGEIETAREKLTHACSHIEIRGAVVRHQTSIDEGVWNASKARQELAMYASSDGSGAKDTIDWSKYQVGFGWFNTDKAGAFTSYQLPHHRVIDGVIKANMRGVAAAMANLLSGFEAGEDREQVYAHLRQHYEDAGRVVPELDTEYTEEELRDIGADRWRREDGPQAPPERDAGEDGAEHKDSGEDRVLALLEALDARLAEHEEAVTIRLGIMGDLLEELAHQRTAPPAKQEHGENDDEANDATKFAEIGIQHLQNLIN